MLLRALLLLVLVCGSRPALGATRVRTTLESGPAETTLDDTGQVPRRIRDSLDAGGSTAARAAPLRRIRSSLDEHAPVEGDEPADITPTRVARSRASFPSGDGVATTFSLRLIRLTLEDGAGVYGFLGARYEAGRRLRLTLD